MNNEFYRVAAFFDFDLTITKIDSFKAFLLFYYFSFSKIHYLPFLFILLVARKFRIISLTKTKEKMLCGLKNKSKAEIENIANRFLVKSWPKLINNLAVDKIQEHKAKGHLVFVISSSPDIIFNSLKNRIDVDGIYSNKINFIDNRFTGKFCESTIFGEGKIDIIKKLQKEFSINLNMSYAYSDHDSDIPMLSTVGKPTAVNPNHSLKLFSEKRNWSIEFWN